MAGPSARVRPTREAVRRDLLDAALRVFAEHGYDSATMDQVAAEAGFTKGALYSNFAGKSALFLALMDQQVNARLDMLDELSRSGPVDPRQLGTVLTNAALHDRDWQLLFLDYWARAVRDPLLRDGFLLHRRRLRGHITKAVTALLGQQGKAGSLPAEHFATLALALSNGLAIEGLVDPDGLPDGLFGEVLAALTSGA